MNVRAEPPTRLTLAACVALAAACGGPHLADGDFRCGAPPDECPPGFSCAPDGYCRSSSPPPDAASFDGDGADLDATASSDGGLCGNGTEETGEECDDGNNTDGDGCDSNCTITACGNGILTSGEGCYTIGTPLQMGVDISSVAIADVNDDLHNDIITTDRGRDLLVYRPAVAGGFPGSFELPAGDEPVALGVRDFNDDGIADVVTANHLGPSATVFTGGSGGLTYLTTIVLANGASPVAAGFVDSDAGARELALLTELPVTHLFVYDGGTGFVPTSTVDTQAVPLALAAAQLDGAGGEDLIVTGDSPNQLTVYLADGTGGFNYTPYSVGGLPKAIAVGNFDADTPVALDLAVVSTAAGTVSFFINNGAGVFTAGDSIAILDNPVAIVALDADVDGETDLAIASSDGAVQLLLNQGGVSFASGGSYVVTVGVTGMAAGDLNDDGIDDLAVSTNGSGGYVTPILSDP